MIHLYANFHLNGFRPTLRCFVFDGREGQELSLQFDTQVNFAGKHDHNNRTAENAFSAHVGRVTSLRSWVAKK